jgi:DNA-binding XRE family transcriptional regulator
VTVVDGAMIRTARHKSGMSVADIAAALSVSTRTVYSWERGGTIHPRYHYRISTLLEEDPSPGPPQPSARRAEWVAWPHYWSTYCIHLRHPDCRLTCKMCDAPCRCPCHLVVQVDQ